ncbi:YcbX family protein [Orbaceae bacterium ESL0721]|nr:YcbX family protein [Orbaceae bacterium ESL0721]
MLTVAALNIFPVKSMQGIALSEATVLATGLKYDRILMISEPDGTFVTAREYPSLLTLRTEIVGEDIVISSPSQRIIINVKDFSPMREPTEVWGNRFTSHIAPISVNRFLSDFLHRDVQLRWIGQASTRTIRRYPDIPLSFADGYPYLLINLASFNYLQKHCPEKLSINQFRGNVIVDGALPFAEDGWQSIKIGEVIFDLVKPCSRCVVITLNPESAKPLADNEPLKTLRSFRSDEQGEIDFGINMVARNQGTIKINDKIEVIERKAAKQYLIVEKSGTSTDHQTVKISFGDHQIEGNNQQTILEQLEEANINIPYSCRAGICGRCQLHLVNGNVTPLTQTAIKADQTILSCSCIPNSDIVLEFKK